MPNFWHQVIEAEAAKLIRRHQAYATGVHDVLRRKKTRTGVTHEKHLWTPQYWSIADGFNPYHVRSRARSIAYALEKAIARHGYRPRNAVAMDIPKLGGGTRTLSVFQVADNAISRSVYLQLMEKNSTRLSSHCYAYRKDLSIHDAILTMASDFRTQSRVFVAEYDFSKFFDTISHHHLGRVLGDPAFLVTSRERAIIEAFLQTPTRRADSYEASGGEARKRGIPQGTSISLFLANAAAFFLDRKLERLGVGFARYADDTVMWSSEYSTICRAVDVLNETAYDMGVTLNLSKSEGISIIASDHEAAEFKKKPCVEFLGYAVARDRIAMKPAAIRRIKEKLAYLIYSNLLEPIKQGHVVPERWAPSVDRDYVTMLFQIRRYIYGDLSESRLRRHLAGVQRRLKFRGLMSFYPIVDDNGCLRELDGWLAHTVHTTLRDRTRRLNTLGFHALPPPHGVDRAGVIGLHVTLPGGTLLDLRLPSFVRIASVLRRATKQFGLSPTANPGTEYTY